MTNYNLHEENPSFLKKKLLPMCLRVKMCLFPITLRLFCIVNPYVSSPVF